MNEEINLTVDEGSPYYYGARAFVTPTSSGATITIIDKEGTTTADISNGSKGDKGDTGATGNGISSIAKTGTSGLVDTYTITYTNGGTATFTVTNGENAEAMTTTDIDNACA